jgi:GT2 family glycosyltransferase
MDVSVIIVNYKTINYLVNAIDSIFEKTKDIDFEIIVVDNNSSDNSEYILQERYSGKIIYLGLSENVGFGRANNKAAEIAKGRNLFLLNPDTLLINNAIKILYDYMDLNAKVAICGGNLFDEKFRPTHSFFKNFSPIFVEFNNLFFRLPEKVFYGKNYFFNYIGKPFDVAYITGADMMIRKDIFDEIRGFDEEFFMYYEDSEISYRIHELNYKIVSVPDARLIHLEGKSFTSSFEKIKTNLISKKIFLSKTQNKMRVIIIDGLFFINIFFHIIMFIIIGNKKKLNLWIFILKEVSKNMTYNRQKDTDNE